jgi:hypothetical protein
MGKNWLIRTKSNHILGPISKEKVLELYQNGSIKADDEICSGNGYWFFIRETDLVDKYLLGSSPQSFNPMSEAKDVLTSNQDHPGSNSTKDDLTIVGGLNLNKMKEDELLSKNQNHAQEKTPLSPQQVVNLPDSSDLEYPEVDKKKNNKQHRVKASTTTTRPLPKSQNIIKYLGIFVFIVLFLVLYFRKTILKSFFSGLIHFDSPLSYIVNLAYAEEESLAEKKNS